MQGTQNSQNNFEKEQSWKTHTTWFQTYYEAKVINIVWYFLVVQDVDRQIEQWNSTEESKNKALHLRSTDFLLGCQYNLMVEKN